MSWTPFSRLFASIFISSMLVSCGEKVALPANVKTYDISYTGTMYLGDTITFQSSAPSNSSVLWEFGDGNTSNRHTAKQVYYKLNHSGTTILDDTIRLIVDNDVHHPNIALIRLKPSVYKLVGNRLWKGGFMSFHGTCCPGLTDHPLADTSFPITLIDSTTVSAISAIMPYLADSNYYSDERTGGQYNNTRIRYTHDTIYYRQRSGNADGWAETTYYHLY